MESSFTLSAQGTNSERRALTNIPLVSDTSRLARYYQYLDNVKHVLLYTG